MERNGLVDAAEDAAQNPWFERAARLGYAANGLLHLAIGALAMALAFGRSTSADQGGALEAVARQPFGGALLWAGGVACWLLALWELSNAAFDRHHPAGRRVKDAAQAVVFAVVGGAFLRYATGGGQDSAGQTSSASAQLMSHPAGVVLLVAGGVAVIGVGGYYVYKGATRRFRRDLRSPSRPSLRRAIGITGTAGYVAKGLVLAAVGLLFIVATAQHDPEEATGIDGALRSVRDQPFGPAALTALAAGLILYAVYLFFRARYDSME